MGGVYPPRYALVRLEWLPLTIAQFRRILNPLESALTRPRASVHYTGLAEKLSPLESALTKNMGGGALPGNRPVTNRQSLGTRAGGRNPAEFRPPKAGALGFSGVSDLKEFAQQDARTLPRSACRHGPAPATPPFPIID